MFQNLCARITTALVLGSSAFVLGCSSSERQSPDLPTAKQASPATDSSVPAPATQPAQVPSSSSPAMRVFIDPKTGEPRTPTAAELAAMERDSTLQAPSERRQTESKLRGGGKAITLEDGVETPLQACTNADGTIVLDHNCQKTQQPQQDPTGGKP